MKYFILWIMSNGKNPRCRRFYQEESAYRYLYKKYKSVLIDRRNFGKKKGLRCRWTSKLCFGEIIEAKK